MRISLAWLFALPLLSGCGLASRKTVLTRPQIIEVPVTEYVPVPHELTAPLPEPEYPPMNCRWRGQPAVCVLDGLSTIERWRGVHNEANADRATTAKLGTQTGNPSQ